MIEKSRVLIDFTELILALLGEGLEAFVTPQSINGARVMGWTPFFRQRKGEG